jgi:hypothetical protein
MWRFDSANSNGPMGYFTGWGGLRFFTGSTPKLTIMQAGNVGIGTTSPAYKLDIAGTTQITNAGGTKLKLADDVTTNRGIVLYDGIYNNENQFYGMGINANLFRFHVDLSASSFAFYAGATSNSSTELMRIKGNGNVGIGTNNPSYQLHLSTDSAAKPSTNTWTVSSDQRLKEDITLADLDVCYSNIKSIPLKYFKWRDDVYTTTEVPDRHKLGWIAQDVEEVFPKAVQQHDMYGYSNCRSLNSDQIYASLYGAVQKMQTIIEDQQQQITSLWTALSNLSPPT